MTNDPKKNSLQGKSLGSGESDDFVLPIAPPAAPPPSRATSATASASVRSPEPPPLEKRPPSLPINSGFAASDSFPVHGTTQSETVDDSGGSSDASVASNTKQAASRSLVAGLICAVVVLLLVVIIQFNRAPEQAVTPAASSSENEDELRKARAETKASRSGIAQMEGKIRDQEELLVASRSEAERQLANLLEENTKLKSQSVELISETSLLKLQLQIATRPITVSEPPPPVQKTPAVQQDGQAYMVAGLRPGDTLNVRTGPGVSYSIVAALHNGAKVTATGIAIMNGPDEWLPCIITLNGVDPATGYNRSWNQKCWINSFFIEPISN